VEVWRKTEVIRSVLSLSFQDKIGVYISKQDEQLIASWAGLIASDDEEQIISRYDMRMKDSAKRFKRLVYARLAEKAAVSIYSSLSSETVEGCSILQIEGRDKRWRDFDMWENRLSMLRMQLSIGRILGKTLFLSLKGQGVMTL
jgi:hypothetical protein